MVPLFILRLVLPAALSFHFAQLATCDSQDVVDNGKGSDTTASTENGSNKQEEEDTESDSDEADSKEMNEIEAMEGRLSAKAKAAWTEDIAVRVLHQVSALYRGLATKAHSIRGIFATEDDIKKSKFVIHSEGVYGEMSPDGLINLLADLNVTRGSKFYDFGSGTGKLVFTAWYLGLKATGVEVIESRFDAACRFLGRASDIPHRARLEKEKEALRRRDQQQQQQRQERRRQEERRQQGEGDEQSVEFVGQQNESASQFDNLVKVEFEADETDLTCNAGTGSCSNVNRTILESGSSSSPSQSDYSGLEVLPQPPWPEIAYLNTRFNDLDISDGDILFTNSIMFSESTMLDMARVARRMKPGALVVSYQGLEGEEFERLPPAIIPVTWRPTIEMSVQRVRENADNLNAKQAGTSPETSESRRCRMPGGRG